MTYYRTCIHPTLPSVDYFDSLNSKNLKGIEYDFDYILDDEAYVITDITNVNAVHLGEYFYQT